MKKEENKDHISLVIGSYAELFSSFDPRPYSEKAVSHDMLTELKHASVDKKEGFDLKLILPENQRSSKAEFEVKKRLTEHFSKHLKEKRNEFLKEKKEGWMWVGIGALAMIIASLFFSKEEYIYKLLITFLEPAGWFFMWDGLEKVFILSKTKLPDYEFYKKMYSATIKFESR